MSAPLDWAAPGVACGIVDDFGVHRSRPKVTMTVVERVTATQVVLANGIRFMRASGRQVGRPSAWGGPSLYPTGHPALERAREIAVQQQIDRVARHLAAVGIDLIDVRTLALNELGDALTSPENEFATARKERAMRVLRVVGSAFAPQPSTEPEAEDAWIKEKQR